MMQRTDGRSRRAGLPIRPVAACWEMTCAPTRFFEVSAQRSSAALAIFVSMLTGAVLAVLVVPKCDFERAALERLRALDATLSMSDLELGDMAARAAKVAVAIQYAEALASPVVLSSVFALALWLALRRRDKPVDFGGVLVAVSWARLPLALRDVISWPAAISSPGLDTSDPSGLLPSNALFYGLGVGTSWQALASMADLFLLWSVLLMAIGSAITLRVSALRTGAVVAFLHGTGALLLWSFT